MPTREERANATTPWSTVGLITYKRTYARPKESGGTEEWNETIERIIQASDSQLSVGFTDAEKERLRYYLTTLKGTVAGRFLWQLGTSTVDKLGLLSLQNCAFTTIDEPVRPFTWAMDALMLGSGVGVNLQREYVYKLPPVKEFFAPPVRMDTASADFIVPDTREGWVELLKRTLESAFQGDEPSGFTYSTQLVRGKGTPIKGFGGVASGPEDLVTGIGQIAGVLGARAGEQLRPVDALDIINIIGSIVVAGNVRRSAIIAIGDHDDLEYLKAKRWDLGGIPNWRAMSNNSVICNDFSSLPEEFWEGYRGNGEPYGLINLRLARSCGRLGDTQYKDRRVRGFNPCQPGFASVLTPEGLKTFDDIDIGSTIWSREGWTTVTNKWSTGIKDVYSYRTTGGEFIGTDNHRVETRDGKVEVDKAAEVLTLAGPCIDITYNKNTVKDGIFFGDGYFKHRERKTSYPVLTIGKDDEDYYTSDEVAPYIGATFGEDTNRKDVVFDTSITPEEKSYTKHLIIPERYLHGSLDDLAGFLRGLYTADGSVIEAKGNTCRVTYKTASKQLALDVQLSLSRLGIRSYITTNKTKDVRFKNGTYRCAESYDVNITKDRARFAQVIGFVQHYKTERLLSRVGYTTSTPTFTSIKEKKHLGKFEVFDITVDNPSHTYWTGGLSVSNCAEQSLEDYETCCLAEVFLPNVSTKAELLDVVKLLYRINKHSLALPCHHPETQAVVQKNMRMGIGITGYLQASEEQRGWLSETYEKLREYDKTYSEQRGFPTSIKLTTIKPSGTLSLLPGVTPGVHPAYSRHLIRRIRIASNHPLVDVCREKGYDVEFQKNFDGTEDHNTVIASFPFQYPEGTLIASEVSALEQLEWVRRLQGEWSDNAVSCTVYYRPEELEGIQEYLKKNYNKNFKSLSFLLHSEHGFAQAPLEEITKEEYDAYVARVEPITSFTDVLDIDPSTECEGGVCPIR